MTSLALQNLSLTTGGALRVDQVNAHVTPGRLIAIVGANGSGKSSLLSLMAGHLTPSSGQVLLDGQPVSSLTPMQRARQLAWLGQSTPGAETFAVRDVVGWGAVRAHRASTPRAPQPGRGDRSGGAVPPRRCTTGQPLGWGKAARASRPRLGAGSTDHTARRT